MVPADRYVLAIEDSAVQAKRLEFFFKKNNIDYKICANAQEALLTIEQSLPILIISDIIMPGMDGYELCSIIKKDDRTKDIPVILLTSLQDPNDIIRGLQAGANNFITKPYDQNYLLSRIKILLDNRDQPDCDDIIKLNYRGETFSIASGKKQILDLLISVYDTAIQRNDELISIKNQLEQSNKELLVANENLDAFTRTVSHDLKSPLSVIIGFASAIKDNPNSTISNDEKEFITHILDSANEMNQLIKDLLTFAKSSTQQINKIDIDISRLSKEICDTISREYSSKNYNIEIEPNLKTNADEALIKVVLTNLLGNAYKYSSKREEPKIIVGSKEYYGKTLIYIKDNGNGFDSQKAQNLFQPFNRFHTDKEFSGTGVGLSTVKRIIDRHNGEIWIESQIDIGTTVYFMI